MACVPTKLGENHPLAVGPREEGLRLVFRGKTRDTYQHPTREDLLIVVATDRGSIFDIVLPDPITAKGEVLTAFTHFWLTGLLKDVPNHLVTDEEVLGPLFATYKSLDRRRTLVVRKLKIQQDEMIFRMHIGGSEYKAAYVPYGLAGGQMLPLGLKKWSFLGHPLFTPSTKAEMGHDQNYDAADYLRRYGMEGRRTVDMLAEAYERAYAFASDPIRAMDNGFDAEEAVLILDVKFETDGSVLGDEVITPDSSRFCTRRALAVALETGAEPESLDKQPLRNWGESIETPFKLPGGIHGLDPNNQAHLAWVHNELQVPQVELDATSSRYLNAARLFFGCTLVEYQYRHMGIAA